MKALGDIAIAERRKPGRKLLLWVGPGWGVGSGAYVEGTGPKQQAFYTIGWFSTLLREARIALYSFTVGETDPRSHLYMGYLGGVESAQSASYLNVYRKVLAVQSGGRVLDQSYDLVREMENCAGEAGVFYTLSFDPPRADHPDEYHELKVQIGKPGMTARTNTGYYNQPYYVDQPSPATKRVTVEQLEQLLDAIHRHGDGEVARQLSALQLTERVSDERLATWIAATHGKKTQQALKALADASAFMPPPPAEVADDAPPDAAAQLRMIALAGDYLKETIPKLPNFFAARTTVHYEESAQFNGASSVVDFEPLHATENFKETVLYRNGSEVADAGTEKRRKRNAKDSYLITWERRSHPVFCPGCDRRAQRFELEPLGARPAWESCGISLCGSAEEIPLSHFGLLSSRGSRNQRFSNISWVLRGDHTRSCKRSHSSSRSEGRHWRFPTH